MIVVTAPTGAIGHQVVTGLLDRGEAVRVIARTPAHLPARTRERAEVVVGSHGDADVVGKAFAGAEAVFWLVPLDPRATSLEAAFLDFTRPACDALVRHGVERVVGISALGRGSGMKAGLVTASLEMDDLIVSTGVAYRALTMPAFMENMFMHVESIRRDGVFSSPIAADLELPTVATRDIAAVAVRLLAGRDWTGHGEAPVLGPADLSFADIAAILSEVLGRTVRYQQVPGEAYKAAMSAAGMSEAMAQGMVEMLLAKNEGLDNLTPRTPESATPTSFRSWCEEVLRPALLG